MVKTQGKVVLRRYGETRRKIEFRRTMDVNAALEMFYATEDQGPSGEEFFDSIRSWLTRMVSTQQKSKWHLFIYCKSIKKIIIIR